MALLVEEERLTGSAARMLGAAIDIDVMEVVLRAALSKAGVLERAAEDGLTMGDVCSGIGTMAAAAWPQCARKTWPSPTVAVVFTARRVQKSGTRYRTFPL